MFSKVCEYGIKSCIFIAINSIEGKRVSPKEISKEVDSPQAFTAKILQAFVKHNVIKSVQGAYGGFEIKKEKISSIKLSHIVNVIDGNSIYSGCASGLHVCDENHPCPVHVQFKKVRDQLKQLLENTNLEQLARNINSGTSFLKI